MTIDTPAWVEEAVVYGVIPRNFGPEGLRSVTGKLSYLQDLGVNALWLAPINASPDGDYGYAVTAYFELRSGTGYSKADLTTLVTEAHARGIRVLMDFVPNHTSDQHPYFLDAQRQGPSSPYYDYYDRDESGDYTYYFNWTHLPNLNYDKPEVERLMLEAFSYWVREFDVDGFRVDAAWGIRQRKPDYWPRWRRELNAIKPDLLLLAEAGARDGYYFTEGFDAAYDWTDELGHWAWEDVFNAPELITRRLDAALTNGGRGFHPDALIFRFLNNNDTGDRFITRYGEGLTRVATALLMTLPGIPCLYTGDEVGAEFSPYLDATSITWEGDFRLHSYHQKLISLRRQMPSLRSRDWERLTVEPEEQVYAYLRPDRATSQEALVILNFSDEEQKASLRLPAGSEALLKAGSLRDVLADENVSVEQSTGLNVPMPPFSARVLVIEPS